MARVRRLGSRPARATMGAKSAASRSKRAARVSRMSFETWGWLDASTTRARSRQAFCSSYWSRRSVMPTSMPRMPRSCRPFKTTGLLRGPAAVHVPGHAAHLVGRRAAEEHRQRAEFFGRDEFAGRLFFQQQGLLGLFDAAAFARGAVVDL